MFNKSSYFIEQGLNSLLKNNKYIKGESALKISNKPSKDYSRKRIISSLRVESQVGSILISIKKKAMRKIFISIREKYTSG